MGTRRGNLGTRQVKKKAIESHNTYRVSQKNALLSLKAYKSGLEAGYIGTNRDSFGILRLSAFI